MFFTYTDDDGRLCALNLMLVVRLVFHDAEESIEFWQSSSEPSVRIRLRPSEYYALKNVLSGRVAPMPAVSPDSTPRFGAH